MSYLEEHGYCNPPPEPRRLRYDELGPEHVGREFVIVEHRIRGSRDARWDGLRGALIAHDVMANEWCIADATSPTGRRYFGPGSVLVEWNPPRPNASKPIPAVGTRVQLTKQFGCAPPPGTTIGTLRTSLDAVAKALHPHWGEGDDRHTYIPQQLAGMVSALRQDLEASVRRELEHSEARAKLERELRSTQMSADVARANQTVAVGELKRLRNAITAALRGR